MWLNQLLCDVRYAIRRLGRERGFAATAVLMLAIGIGASTAIFTIVQAVLLRPFGVGDPGRVVMLWPGDTRHGSVGELSFQAHRDMRAGEVVRGRGGGRVRELGGTIVMPDGQPLGLSAGAVSASFFEVLRARPLLGRTFRPEDDEPTAPRVLVLSHAVWTERFGADPNAVGRVVMVKEEAPAQPFEIVDVMPAEFSFPAARATGRPRARGWPASPVTRAAAWSRCSKACRCSMGLRG